ncbi:cupin domain-containing protein, partial [Staphylococcus epidermidis]|uniref:cupin domain-containing protein n=1 Tax=Staphylococcus epidermidis TaxID=1282 RepID=UPI0011A92BE5
SHFHTIHPHQLSYYHPAHTFKIHIITPKPQYHTVKLPTHIHSPESLQYSLPKATIFPSTLHTAQPYTLLPSISQPPFQYHHFQLLTQQYFIPQYPQYQSIIKTLAISQEH